MPPHLLECEDRQQRLRLESPCTIVPEHGGRSGIVLALQVDTVEGRIQNRLAVALDEGDRVRRHETAVAAQAGPVDADGEVQILGVSKVRMMTGTARNLLVSGEDRIPEEQPPQLHLLQGLWIVRRRGELPGQRGEREVSDGPFEAIPAAVPVAHLSFTQLRITECQYDDSGQRHERGKDSLHGRFPRLRWAYAPFETKGTIASAERQ